MEDDWYYKLLGGNISYSVQLSLLLLVILLFIYPLYKISKTRLALMILFSKAIASLLCNAGSLYVWISMNVIGGKTGTEWYIKYVQFVYGLPCMAVRVHLVMMACNRAHSIYFPYSYASFAKKKNLRLFCAIIWAISIGLSVANSLIGEYKIMLPFPLSLFSLGSIYDFCSISALILYAVMGAKLIWMKWQFPLFKDNYQIGGTQLEKDHWRISLTCLASVLPYILNRASILISKLPFYQNSRLFIDFNKTLGVPGNLMAQISEEICLLILCLDFRTIVLKMVGQIFGWILFVLTFGNYKLTSGQDGNNNNDCLFIRTKVSAERNAAVRPAA